MCDITTVEMIYSGRLINLCIYEQAVCVRYGDVYPFTGHLLDVYGLHHEGVVDYGRGSESEKRRGRMSVLRLGAQGGTRASGGGDSARWVGGRTRSRTHSKVDVPRDTVGSLTTSLGWRGDIIGWARPSTSRSGIPNTAEWGGCA